MRNDPTESYRTHSNYIDAFSQMVFRPIPFKKRDMHPHLRKRIHSSVALPGATGNTVDLQQVRTCLQTAWGTEALLRMTERVVEEEELLRLSNNWSVIQTYYVLYHSTQALHVAKGQPRPQGHSSTQNIFYTHWCDRPILLEPWSLGYGSNGVRNSPDGVDVDVTVHSWTACEGDNLWNLACKSLKTTRCEALKKKWHDARMKKKSANKRFWQQEEKERLRKGRKPRKEPDYATPQLTREEKVGIDSKLRPFTLMDYLYRLRVKTNYEDSNMFTDGPEDNSSSRFVRDALCRIAGGTLFLHELAVMKIIGADTLHDWAQAWVERNLPKESGGLQTRLVYFQE